MLQTDLAVPLARSLNSVRSISYSNLIPIDVYERAELEQQAKHDFDRTIDYMRQSGRYTEKEILEFKKAAIIKKSVDEVIFRADY